MEVLIGFLLFFADVDRWAFNRAPRNEKNYILFICISILVAVSLTSVSVFYFVKMLFRNFLMAVGMGAAAGGMVYFFHRTLLRDNNRNKLYAMILVALFDGALLAIPLKIALMKPFLEKQIIAETKTANDDLYQDLVLDLKKESFEKKKTARQAVVEAGKVYDERGKGVQELVEARRAEKMVLEAMELELPEAEKRYENLKKEPDTSFMGLLSKFLGTTFGENSSPTTVFSNLAFLFFFFIFEAAPVLIRLMFNENNSLYLQEIEHKTNMAFKGTKKVQEIDNNIMEMDDMNGVRLAIMEKKVWNELTQLMSQDDPDETKLYDLQQTIAYIEVQKGDPSPPDSPSKNGMKAGEEDDGTPEFEYNF